ncbi:MAG TPA: lysophospholipid acyltransferase family protein [Actinomycetota bacterium]
MRRPEPFFTTIEWILRPALGAWFNWRFEGEEHIPSQGPLLVAANHVSQFDPLADGLMLVRAGRHPRYLAKNDLWDNGFLRFVLNASHQIPVQRGSGSAAPLDSAVRALKDGECVVVYPEATTTRNPDQLPMQGKTGIARLALTAEVPVLPIAVWGSHHIFQKGQPKNLTFGRPIWLRAGAPIDFSDRVGYQEDPTALREVTDAIMGELTVLVTDLRSRYPQRWA